MIKPEDIPDELIEKLVRPRKSDDWKQQIADDLNVAIEAGIVDISERIRKARDKTDQLAGQLERAKKQMTLGQLIDKLSEFPGDMQVTNLAEPHSYRGIYCDLAFECRKGTRPAADVLRMCKACLDELFTGCRGGDFTMHRGTPVWIAGYMQWPGTRLLQVGDDGSIATAEPYFVENDD
jgi:hypothetical protein